MKDRPVRSAFKSYSMGRIVKTSGVLALLANAGEYLARYRRSNGGEVPAADARENDPPSGGMARSMR